MSNKIRNATIIQWFVGAVVFWVASFQLFQASVALAQSAAPAAGIGGVGQARLAIAEAVVCGLGSICLAVGSVLLDKRMRARKKLAGKVLRAQA